MKGGSDDFDGSSEHLPERLVDQQGRGGDLLRRYVRQAQPSPPADAAWERTVVRLVRKSRSSRLTLGLAMLAGATAMGALVGVGGWLRSPRPQNASVAAIEQTTGITEGERARGPAAEELAHEGNAGPVLSLARGPVRLPSGPSRLESHARVTLSRGGQAHAAASKKGLTLVLEDGELGLDERAAHPGQPPVVVVAAPYRLVVMGAAFRVSRTRDDVVVEVDAGRIAVERNGVEVAAVTAGSQWSGTAMRSRSTSSARGPIAVRSAENEAIRQVPPVAASSSASERCPSGSPPRESCSACGRRREERRCRPRWRSIRRRRSTASRCAIRAGRFLSCTARSRFPAGALRAEVSLSLAELLPQLGNYEEALAESTTALALASGARRGDVHLLRARILAAGLHDCAGAARELSAAGEASSASREQLRAEISRCEDKQP